MVNNVEFKLSHAMNNRYQIWIYFPAIQHGIVTKSCECYNIVTTVTWHCYRCRSCTTNQPMSQMLSRLSAFKTAFALEFLSGEHHSQVVYEPDPNIGGTTLALKLKLYIRHAVGETLIQERDLGITRIRIYGGTGEITKRMTNGGAGFALLSKEDQMQKKIDGIDDNDVSI